MCGYTDYSDPRLQSPDEGDEPQGAFECWMSCTHANACASLFKRFTGKTIVDVWAMGCEDCEEWEEL